MEGSHPLKQHEVVCNDDIDVVMCKEYMKGQLFLAAVPTEGKVHVLHNHQMPDSSPMQYISRVARVTSLGGGGVGNEADTSMLSDII